MAIISFANQKNSGIAIAITMILSRPTSPKTFETLARRSTIVEDGKPKSPAWAATQGGGARRLKVLICL